jgi:LacI family transcriptional regulator, fructose operon transcriptional repressor
MKVGIKDVARVARVSPATVSRVLSGGNSVSDALRAQVEAAVLETGYLPNLSARRLRSRHSHTIGLIVADIRNPFFTAVGRVVEDIAYRAGMRVILCNTGEDPEKEAFYLKLMEEERVTGAIFAPTRQSADRAKAPPPGFPMVLLDRVGPYSREDTVVLDNVAAAAMLVEHLHERGYRKMIGLFGNTSMTGQERRDGFVQALSRYGLAAEAVFVSPNAEAAEAEIAHRLTGAGASGRPDAIICSNSLILLGAVRAIKNAGLGIPADVAVAGFDNEHWTELVGSGITVIEQPVEEIGATAMNMLLGRLETPDAPIRKVVLSGRCIVRGSTEAKPLAAE